MSDGGKQLKILVTVDEQQVRRGMDLIGRLTEMAKKSVTEINRAQQSAFNVGSGGGRAGLLGGAQLSARSGVTPQSANQNPLGGVGQRLTQALSEQSTIFRAISQGSKDSLRVMSDELRRNLAMQKQELKSMGETVKALSSEYVTLTERAQRFSKSGAHDLAASTGLAAKDTLLRSIDMMAARDEKQRLVSSLKDNLGLLQGPPGGGTPPGGPGGGGAATPPGGSGLSAGDVALIAGSVGRAVGSAIGGVGGFVQSGKTLHERDAASIAQALPGRFLGKAMQGDIRDLYYMRHSKTISGQKMTDAMSKSWGDYEGTGAAQLGLLGTAVEGAGSAASSAAQMLITKGKGGGGAIRTSGEVAGAGAGVVGGALQSADAIRRLAGGGANAVEAATISSSLDLAAARSPLTNAAFDVLSAERGIRANSSRRLMGRHMSARGTGMGYGYDFGQSTGIAEGLQRLGGMQGMFGTSTSKTIAGYGGATDAQRDLFAQAMANPDIPQSTKILMAQGMAATESSRVGPKTITTKSRGLLQGSMQMAAAGIDMGTAQSSLANIFQASGSSSAEGTIKAIERAVERGTAKGFSDPRTQEEVIGAMGRAAAGVIMSGTSGVEHVGAFLTAGGGGNMSLAQTQGRVQALQGLDNLSSNPFFQGVNMASAKGILGGGASPLSMMAMGGATVSQLLTGGKSFDVHGISESQRMQMLQASVGSKASAYMSLLSGEEQGRYKEGGFKSLGKDSTFKILRAMKSFGNDQTAMGLSEILTSGDMTALGSASGKRMKNFTDGLAAASISMEEQMKMEVLGKTISAQMSEIFKGFDAKAMVKHLKEFEKQSDEYDFSKGKTFIVKIVKEIEQLDKTPANAKAVTAKE